MKCKTCKYYWNNGKDESCDKRGWDFERIDCPDFASKYKPKTNADRIRSLTDEELAEWGSSLPCCPPGKDLSECCFGRPDPPSKELCGKCWLGWLKQEVDK